MKHGYGHGCRCDTCTDRHTIRHREWRRRQRTGNHHCPICDAPFTTQRARDLHELYQHDRHEKQRQAMADEYTARQARYDAMLNDLERICQILWDAACDHDPTIRHHPVGRNARRAAA